MESLSNDLTLEPDEIKARIDEILTNYGDSLETAEQKVDGCVKYMRVMDGDIATLDAEIKRVTARKKSLDNCRARFKQYIIDCLKTLEESKIKTVTWSASYSAREQGNLVIDNEANIPPKYFKRTPKLQLSDFKDAVKAGKETIDGCAHWEPSETLRIR